MKTSPCECENAAHFADCVTTSGKRLMTPNGNPGHDYGADFNADQLKPAFIEGFGTFTVCSDCFDDCHRAAKKELEA